MARESHAFESNANLAIMLLVFHPCYKHPRSFFVHILIVLGRDTIRLPLHFLFENINLVRNTHVFATDNPVPNALEMLWSVLFRIVR